MIDLPSPASGLIGRQRELMRIGTRLLEGKKPLTVTLHGAGGIGKTALLREALLRFAPSFDLTLAVGLDPLPSLEGVLGQIEKFLEMKSPSADDTQEREALVRNALTSRRAFLGLDNFETLNHALNDEGSENENIAKSLHRFFSSLCSAGGALCVTSREATDLPNEELVDIYGLEETSGGRLFHEFAGSRKDTLTESQTYEISAAVGGHPLALQLLGSAYKNRADLNPNEFLQEIQSLLSEARNKWGKTKRHINLEECFAFSIDNLPKNAEGESLRTAISRLSVFVSFFADFTAAPVLENGYPKTDEQFSENIKRSHNALHALWERGLLERLTLPLQDENFHLYRLHPALGFFAKERLTDAESVEENYWKSMSNLARIAEEQITKSPLMARITSSAIPDLLVATEAKSDAETALMQFRMSKLLQQFGLYDDSLRLLERSRQTNETFNNLKGKSATLHQMAGIFVTRGDLDGAMKLYQQAREILEGLGDLKGKSMTLGMMSKVYWKRQNYTDAIASLLKGLMQLVELKIEPRTQQAMASDMAGWRRKLGVEKFDSIWKEITGQENLPEWLTQNPEQGQGMTAEQFIAGAIQAAREKLPEAEQYFNAARKLAGDPSAPQELQALGKVLQKILLGEKNVDTSSLPNEWAELIQRMKGEG